MIENKELKAEIVKNLEVYEKISHLVEVLDEEVSTAVVNKVRNWCEINANGMFEVSNKNEYVFFDSRWQNNGELRAQYKVLYEDADQEMCYVSNLLNLDNSRISIAFFPVYSVLNMKKSDYQEAMRNVYAKLEKKWNEEHSDLLDKVKLSDTGYEFKIYFRVDKQSLINSILEGNFESCLEPLEDALEVCKKFNPYANEVLASMK